jgi:hypothetical protein
MPSVWQVVAPSHQHGVEGSQNVATVAAPQGKSPRLDTIVSVADAPK